MCVRVVLPLTRALDNLAKQNRDSTVTVYVRQGGPAQASRERKRGGAERRRCSQQTGALHKAEHTADVCEASSSSSLLHQPPCCLVPANPATTNTCHHAAPWRSQLYMKGCHRSLPRGNTHTQPHHRGTSNQANPSINTHQPHTPPPALNRYHHHALLLLNCCCSVLTAAPRAAEWCSADLSTHHHAHHTARRGCHPPSLTRCRE